MDKELALRVMMLMSALESWAFSIGKPIPDHMLIESDSVIEKLRAEVLK